MTAEAPSGEQNVISLSREGNLLITTFRPPVGANKFLDITSKEHAIFGMRMSGPTKIAAILYEESGFISAMGSTETNFRSFAQTIVDRGTKRRWGLRYTLEGQGTQDSE